MEASSKGDVDAVAGLLAHGDARRSVVARALIMASGKGHTDVAAWLLAHADVDVNQGLTGNGFTALMAASKHGHVDVVTLLLTHGADVNQGRTDGTTALMMASQNGHADVVTLLLAHEGVDVNQGRPTTA